MDGRTDQMEPLQPGPTAGSRTPFRVRLPGFIGEHEVGLGDVIKRTTSAAGIRPCGGCAARAAALNRWVTFRGRR